MPPKSSELDTAGLSLLFPAAALRARRAHDERTGGGLGRLDGEGTERAEGGLGDAAQGGERVERCDERWEAIARAGWMCLSSSEYLFVKEIRG